MYYIQYNCYPLTFARLINKGEARGSQLLPSDIANVNALNIVVRSNIFTMQLHVSCANQEKSIWGRGSPDTFCFH